MACDTLVLWWWKFTTVRYITWCVKWPQVVTVYCQGSYRSVFISCTGHVDDSFIIMDLASHTDISPTLCWYSGHGMYLSLGLTHGQLEIHGSVLSTAAIDALMLKQSYDIIPMVFISQKMIALNQAPSIEYFLCYWLSRRKNEIVVAWNFADFMMMEIPTSVQYITHVIWCCYYSLPW